MNNELMFSSRHQAWDTPQDFFDEQNKRFGFTLDVAASFENAKCKKYFSKEDDALNKIWTDVCWLNPPYGRKIGRWVKKAYQEADCGLAKTVMLLPARTDTAYFHDWIYKKKNVEVEFIRGRLTFGSDAYWKELWETELIDGKPNKLFGKHGKKNPAPFPSMLVIFNP